MLFVIAMGEIKPGNVHPGSDHLQQDLIALAAGSERANDLCVSGHARIIDDIVRARRYHHRALKGEEYYLDCANDASLGSRRAHLTRPGERAFVRHLRSLNAVSFGVSFGASSGSLLLSIGLSPMNVSSTCVFDAVSCGGPGGSPRSSNETWRTQRYFAGRPGCIDRRHYRSGWRGRRLPAPARPGRHIPSGPRSDACRCYR